MRSKKNLVIGFLLLLLGIGLSEHSLLLSIFAGVAGIVMMILYAAGKLKRNTSETSVMSSKTSEIQPTTKTSQYAERLIFVGSAAALSAACGPIQPNRKQWLFRVAGTD